MASGSFTGSTNNANVQPKIVWSSTKNVSGNYSTVTATLHYSRLNTGYTTSGTGSFTITINGSSASVSKYISITYNSETVAVSHSVKVNHGTDGTKSITISATGGIPGTSCTTTTISKTVALDTIERLSTLTVSDGTLGTNLTLTATKLFSAAKHTLSWSCGTASGSIVTSASTATSFTWTSSTGNTVALAAQNTTGTNVKVKFTLTTYNGSTSLGSKSVTVYCAIPDSVKPSCSISVSDSAGYYSTYGKYVKGLSKLSVKITPTLAYSSPIASYSAKANGTTYKAASFTTAALTSSADITATVTDKRGRKSATASASVPMYSYSKPSVSKLTAVRCASDGTSDPQGAYVKVTFSAAVSSLGDQNSAAYIVRYKKSSASAWETEATQTAIADTYSVSGQTYVFAADTGSSYNVQVAVSDDIYSGITANTTASTASVIQHFNANGIGIGIGKISESGDWAEALDVDLPAYLRKNVKIGGATTLGGTLDVVGDSAFSGAVEFEKRIVVPNATDIYVRDENDELRSVLIARSSSGNTAFGYGNYSRADSSTNIYGNDVNLYIANIANPGSFRPYYRRNDSLNITLNTSGYTTSNAKEVLFWVPICRPIIGAPTVSAVSVNGIKMFQSGNYTHGSSSSTWAKPTSYEVTLVEQSGIAVQAILSASTNATASSPIGVYWSGKINLT